MIKTIHIRTRCARASVIKIEKKGIRDNLLKYTQKKGNM